MVLSAVPDTSLTAVRCPPLSFVRRDANLNLPESIAEFFARFQSETQGEWRDAERTANQLCSLGHDRLRNRESRAFSRLSELGKQPFHGCEHRPSKRPEPASHRHGDGGEIADGQKQVLEPQPRGRGGCPFSGQSIA